MSSSQAFDRLDRAQDLLEGLAERCARGEPASLEALIAEYPLLETELRELAAACNEIDRGFSEQAARTRAAHAEVERILEDVGRGAGFASRYTLEGEIGQGGMGAVLRVRDQKLDRQLAMKVILGQAEAKASGGTPPVSPHQLKRFLNEAKITGQLDHPGIVPVHEVGVDERGRAYFTMKLVRGKTLAEVFELNRGRDVTWNTPKVLGVIQRVCEAVAFAHERCVIHRDLKPANVMVGDFGEVYVMDWGLARRLAEEAKPSEEGRAADAEIAGELSLTREGRIVGTPCYMPPEQARGEIAHMGPQSDVYAIGAMLYELVAGTPPYVEAGERVSSEVLLARIQAGPPKSPVSRALAPELGAIVEKSMRQDVSERYASVRELAADLERFVAGRTVRALRVDAWAELRKWVGRNKALAMSMASSMLLLLGGLSLALVLVQRLEERTRALETANQTVTRRSSDLAAALQAEQANAELAEERRAETEKVAEFQSRMLADLSPDELGHTFISELEEDLLQSWEKLGWSEEQRDESLAALRANLRPGNPTNVALQVLERSIFEPAVRTIDSEYGENPLLAAMLQSSLAEVLRRVGLYGLGEHVARNALGSRRVALGEGSPYTLGSINTLATVLFSRGKLTEAEALCREALAGRRLTLGDEHDATLQSIGNLALVLRSQGKLEEAEPLCREALAGRRAKLGDEHSDTLTSIDTLAGLLHSQGKLAEAEQLLREALAGCRAQLGNEHQDTIASINNLALLLRDRGNLAEAEQLAREALANCRAKLGDGHPKTLSSINNLALLLQVQGEAAEARSLFSEALAGYRVKLGNEHADTLTSMDNLAVLLQSQGKLVEAEPLSREALAGFRATLGERHALTLASSNNLALLLHRQGKLAEAESLAREALKGFRAQLGDDHFNTLSSIDNLAVQLHQQGKFAEAEPLFREVLAGRRANLGDDHSDTLRSILNLAVQLHKQGELGEAEQLFLEALAGFRAKFGDDDRRTQDLLEKLTGLRTQLQALEPYGGHEQQAEELR